MTTVATNKIKLDHPFTIDGREITEITMRRMKVKDEVWSSKQPGNDAERGVSLLGRLCDEPPEVMEELDSADAAKLEAFLPGFRSAA